MRVAILGEPAGWHVGRLLESLRDRGHEASAIRWQALAAEVEPGDGRRMAERFLPEVIEQADIVVVRGMPAGGLEEVIFRMDVLGRLAARGTAVVNAPRSLETAIDKYLSLARLADAGIPVPRTIVAQDPESILAAWRSFGGDCVRKPLFGSQGRGIERVSTRESLDPLLAAAEAAGAVAYLQEFVPHGGWDARILLFGEQVFSMKRVADDDWRTNLALGARAEPFSPPASWINLAREAAAVLETEIAGVDLLPASDGRLLVLEFNAVPGWRGLEAAVGVDVAAAVVRHLERRG